MTGEKNKVVPFMNCYDTAIFIYLIGAVLINGLLCWSPPFYRIRQYYIIIINYTLSAFRPSQNSLNGCAVGRGQKMHC